MPERFVLTEGAKKLLGDVWSASSYRSIQALASTLGSAVILKSSETRMGILKEIPSLLNPAQSAVTVVTIKLKGTVSGVIFVFANQSDMLGFADMLLHKAVGTSKNLDDSNISVIKELGNILSGYYVEAFIKMIGSDVKMSIPEIGFNEFRVIEKTGFGNVYQDDINVLMFESEFCIRNEGFIARVLVVFNELSSNNIYNSILSKV